MQTEAAQRLQQARIHLLLDEPFFGSLMMQMQPEESPRVRRFCTNGQKLWFNPDYMAKLGDGHLRTVLAHEVLHPALLHPFRLGKRDLRIANEAADYVVNSILEKYNQDAVKRGQVAPFPWPLNDQGQPDVLLDPAYDGMSFEEVYDVLTRKPPGGNGGGNNPQGNGGAGAGQGQGQGNSQPNPSSDPSAPSDPSDSPAGPGEFTAAPADEAEAKAQEAQWKVALKQAALGAKMQGRLPADIERLVTELLNPKLSWREILRTLLTSAAKDDYTWTRPNRRYTHRGLILPSLHVPRMGRVVVAIDTSGSIGQEELNAFMAEVRAILFDVRPETMVTVQCDAEIQEWLEHDPGDEVEITLKGGGGTDFRPVFERIAQEPEPPAALVYLTDLYGTAPDEAPAYPVIWACNNEQDGPFGETVHI